MNQTGTEKRNIPTKKAATKHYKIMHKTKSRNSTKITTVQSPLTTLGQEIKQSYSTATEQEHPA